MLDPSFGLDGLKTHVSVDIPQVLDSQRKDVSPFQVWTLGLYTAFRHDVFFARPPLSFFYFYFYFFPSLWLCGWSAWKAVSMRDRWPQLFFAAYLDFHFFSTHIKCPFSGLVSFFLSLSGRKFSIRRFYAISKSQIKRVFKAHTPVRSSGHQFRAGGQVGKAKSQASLKEKCDRSDHCRRVKEETAVSRAKECDRCDRPPHLPTLMASF